jgi:putative hydroxymethylpyrimidine transport system substrate-binding protein
MRIFCVVGLMMAVLTAAGCGGESETKADHMRAEKAAHLEKLRVTLDGQEGAENVGIVMAQKRGFFADAGLAVSVLGPALPARPVPYVATREDDLGVTQEPQLVLAKEKGAPVVAVGSLIGRPTAAMIWLKKSRIDGMADLKGKTIAIPGVPFQKAFLKSCLARYGLTLADVKVKNVGYELVPALVSGRADAIFGGSPNLEGVALESRGLETVATPLQSLGAPRYEELVVIARTDRVAKEPGLIRGFMSAVARGTAAAMEDPHEAIEAIEEVNAGTANLNRKVLEAQLSATLPLLSRSGYMDPEVAAHLVSWMHGEGMIENPPLISDLLTNEFVARRP